MHKSQIPVFKGRVPAAYLTDAQMQALGLRPLKRTPDALQRYDLRPALNIHGTRRLFLRENTGPQGEHDAGTR
ncbi:hypothetical protein [Deinococcus wulumuqiensis]|uniref:hypothetical protein n=1 Tax=Deinococcus wulumuqiensis TaxID=980427 RepID=UPI00242C6E3E|nr:hypothetical protein [Deinococcus wulumuqiensis]